MGYQSESSLENEVLNQLESIGYERVKIRSHDELLHNFRKIINERHMSELNYRPLSDDEFDRLITDINGKSVFDSAMILRDQYVLKRDDESIAYIEFIDQNKWCQNKFQVTNQISVKDTYKSRYDVTILINGLPLVQIELKRSGVAITEAFNQVERYRKDNFTGLFRYIQMFVISNKMETRYYANSDQKMLKSSMFYWSDEKNKRINYLKDFIKDFLEPCQLAKMISRYMVVNETDKLLMALRPYQVYAVEKLIERALETNNNGYIWHTTGSGKTLTSFKASQILSQQKGIKKVIFLVDRKDLDSQTLSEFNKFQEDSVDLTDNTRKLLKQLGDGSKPLIVTTMQKMSHAIKSNNPVMDRYKQDKVIFIIDECHRTQFGAMHRQIKQHFKNAQYFGFTGTPRFEENKSQDGRTTADIFDKCLHYYLIKDAIRDGNVLGFSVDYAKTYDVKKNISEAELLSAKDRTQKIVNHIIKNYNKKTGNGTYTSLLTVPSIPMAIQYYSEFKEAKIKGNHDLNITTIFSLKPNEDANEEEDFVHSREILDIVMSDYNEIFGTNHSTDNTDAYFADISRKMKEVNPIEKIDILIVVNMFLTGFDSKKLNTLYVDKNLKHHDLIQAYSRTNRIEKETKPYGNIVCYRDLKKATDEAIEIFSQTDNTDTVIGGPYEEYLTEFKNTLRKLFIIAPTPADVDLLEKEDDEKVFVLDFKKLATVLVKLKTFEEFEFTEEHLGISEQTFLDYRSKYLNLYDKYRNGKGKPGGEESDLSNIDFNIEVLRNDVINVQYIMNLIGQIDLNNKEEQDKNRQQIHELLNKAADDEKLRLKANIIRHFLDRVVPTLTRGTDINDAYYKYEEKIKRNEIEEFANEKDYPSDLLVEIIDEYEFSGNINKNSIDKGLVGKGGLLSRAKKADQVRDFIKETVKKYASYE